MCVLRVARRNVYKQRSPVAAISPNKDWSENFVDQLGYGGNAEFTECMRLYLFLHRSAPAPPRPTSRSPATRRDSAHRAIALALVLVILVQSHNRTSKSDQQ